VPLVVLTYRTECGILAIQGQVKARLRDRIVLVEIFVRILHHLSDPACGNLVGSIPLVRLSDSDSHIDELVGLQRSVEVSKPFLDKIRTDELKNPLHRKLLYSGDQLWCVESQGIRIESA
jgi:hypothetical protein